MKIPSPNALSKCALIKSALIKNVSINSALLYSFFVSGALLSHSLSASDQFGPAFATSNSVAVSQILSDPAAYVNKTVTVRGTVSEVCQKKGCWLQFKTDAAAPVFRLKVRDGDMVFPVSARGKTAYATGLLSANHMTLAQSRDYLAHRAEEQGEPFDASSVQPLTVYQLAPVSVLIE